MGQFNFVFSYVGLPERALQAYQRNAEAGYQIFATVLWAPNYRQARSTAQFRSLARKMGLVDYWRAHGWPDLCHPVGADDFACN